MKLVMVMYIYVDVLLILNLYVNYFCSWQPAG